MFHRFVMLRAFVAGLYFLTAVLGVHAPVAWATDSNDQTSLIEICTGLGVKLVRISYADEKADPAPDTGSPESEPVCPYCIGAGSTSVTLPSGLSVTVHGTSTGAGTHCRIAADLQTGAADNELPDARAPPTFL